jgi:hypothetical protein
MNTSPGPSDTPRSSRPLWLIWIGGVVLLLLTILAMVKYQRLGNPIKRHEARVGAQTICMALNTYFREYGSLPNGTHLQIVKALQGGNPRGIIFLAVPARRMSLRGEFLDPWGAPYVIDTSKPGQPKAHSIGIDGKDDGGDSGSDDVEG